MAHQQVITTEKHVTQRQLTTAAAMEIGDSLHIDKTLEETLSGPDIGKVLSKRERQILEYIVEGNTNKEIAQKLYRTQRTVEYHRNRLMRKLDTHTTAELVKRAILMGIC